jgi:hypothetical protein
MTWADGVTLLGLFLGTVGALLLAFDPLYRSGTQFQVSMLEIALKNVQRGRKGIQEGWKNLLAHKPPNEAYIRSEIEKERLEGDEEERSLEASINEYKEKYEKEVFTKGKLGAALLCVGFILQGIGILIQPKKEAKPVDTGTQIHSLPVAPVSQSIVPPPDVPECVGPFNSGNDRGEGPEKAVNRIAGQLNEERSGRQLMSLFVLGSADNQRLRKSLKSKFVSNRGLAQARALWVDDRMQGLLQFRSPSVVIISSGPTIEAKSAEERERDRFVEVYPVWQTTNSQPGTTLPARLILGNGCPVS